MLDRDIAQSDPTEAPPIEEALVRGYRHSSTHDAFRLEICESKSKTLLTQLSWHAQRRIRNLADRDNDRDTGRRNMLLLLLQYSVNAPIPPQIDENTNTMHNDAHHLQLLPLLNLKWLVVFQSYASERIMK